MLARGNSPCPDSRNTLLSSLGGGGPIEVHLSENVSDRWGPSLTRMTGCGEPDQQSFCPPSPQATVTTLGGVCVAGPSSDGAPLRRRASFFLTRHPPDRETLNGSLLALSPHGRATSPVGPCDAGIGRIPASHRFHFISSARSASTFFCAASTAAVKAVNTSSPSFTLLLNQSKTGATASLNFAFSASVGT